MHLSQLGFQQHLPHEISFVKRASSSILRLPFLPSLCRSQQVSIFGLLAMNSGNLLFEPILVRFGKCLCFFLSKNPSSKILVIVIFETFQGHSFSGFLSLKNVALREHPPAQKKVSLLLMGPLPTTAPLEMH